VTSAIAVEFHRVLARGEDGMDAGSIEEAQENVAKLQAALGEAQEMLAAAQRAQEAAQRAHEAAEEPATMLRSVSLVAIGVIVVAVLLSLRRRRR
jgi:hypothetical protein